jgi:hypothetical protein
MVYLLLNAAEIARVRAVGRSWRHVAESASLWELICTRELPTLAPQERARGWRWAGAAATSHAWLSGWDELGLLRDDDIGGGGSVDQTLDAGASSDMDTVGGRMFGSGHDGARDSLVVIESSMPQITPRRATAPARISAQSSRAPAKAAASQRTIVVVGWDGIISSWLSTHSANGGDDDGGGDAGRGAPHAVVSWVPPSPVREVACGSHFVIALTHRSTIFTSASAGGSGSGGSGGVVSEAERNERSDLERGASECSLDGASASVGRRASSFGSFSSDVADGAGSSSPSSYVNGAHHFGKPQPQPCAASKGERGRNNSDGDSGCGARSGHSGSGGGSGGGGSRRHSRRAAIAIKRAKENERELARECQRQRERGMTMGLSAFCALPTPDGSDGCPYDFGNFGVGAARDARAVADAAGSTDG